MATSKTAKSFDDYVDRFSKDVQQRLQKVRLTVKKAAPQAMEKISYGIPSFTLTIAAFKEELSVYKGAKGSVQFPFDKPLPLALISRMVKFRVKENLSKGKKK